MDNTATSHCECCGSSDPELDTEGYTRCCNELVCDGGMRVDNGQRSMVSGKPILEKLPHVEACVRS